MTRRLAAVVLAAGVVLMACGNETSDAGAGGTAATTAATGDTTPGATTTTTGARAAQARRGVRLVKVGDFRNPLYATSPPGDTRRLMVVEQNGRIMVVRGGRKLATPF